MFNLRQIDKFILSSGWDNTIVNLDYLKSLSVRAILDLQFVPGIPGTDASIEFIKNEAAKRDIEYKAILFRDDEFNVDLEGIFEEGAKTLTEWEAKYSAKRDKIIVKCSAGISRSPAMLIYYYCVSRRMSYIEALNYVREIEYNKRVEFGASPNAAFSQFLRNKFK